MSEHQAGNFNPKRMKLARQARGLSERELADRLGMTRYEIVAIEADRAPVGEDFHERLALALSWPWKFFFMDDPPEVHWRRVDAARPRPADMPPLDELADAVVEANAIIHRLMAWFSPDDTPSEVLATAALLRPLARKVEKARAREGV